MPPTNSAIHPAGHPAIQPGATAVITGAASGIGLAAALRFAGLGLNVVMADRDEGALEAAARSVSAVNGISRVLARPTDVSDADEVARLREAAFARFGAVAVLMNNAGVGGGGHAFQNPDRWARLLSVNLFGVVNGVQAFAQAMIDQNTPGLIINTGSKQGITTPPGDTAYNVSKAGVKALTEGLQHTLRETPGCQVSAHLLVPGFTFTGMTRPGVSEKPAGAWTAAQVIDFALERIAAGDFYILCPDNEVTREIDNARIAWAAGDITGNRPPLSRWHRDWKDVFAAHMAKL
jgi:NAD(P)-dependent dehydrogenase (short-subunit alcohol dehydrogenase family)